MPELSLQTAMVNYGYTRPLIDGTVNSDRIELVHVHVSYTHLTLPTILIV